VCDPFVTFVVFVTARGVIPVDPGRHACDLIFSRENPEWLFTR
jgi:hypothetical protein